MHSFVFGSLYLFTIARGCYLQMLSSVFRVVVLFHNRPRLFVLFHKLINLNRTKGLLSTKTGHGATRLPPPRGGELPARAGNRDNRPGSIKPVRSRIPSCHLVPRNNLTGRFRAISKNILLTKCKRKNKMLTKM